MSDDTPASSGWGFLAQTFPVWPGQAPQHVIGRLSTESNGSAQTVFGYDGLGRTNYKSVCTPSTCGTDHYDMHAMYDLAGNPTFLDRGLDAARNATAPNAGHYFGGLSMIYNNAGQLSQANADIVDATHPQIILGALNYNPLGKVYTVELGQQYGQVSQYDKRERMMDRYSINLAGYTVLQDHWDYDSVGNVMDAIDSAQGEFSYLYDTLNRVYSATIPPFTEAYGYDPWGNQISHSVTEGSSYQWAYMPTTQNRATNNGASYDSSGNMLSDGLHSYTYDAENRLLGVTDQGVQYRYDAEGMRVATLTGGAVTAEYLYDLASSLVTTVNPDGSMVRSILRDNEGTHWGDYIGGSQASNGRTEFRLVNQVGTLVANGDSQGNIIEGCLSGPFGDGQICTPSYDYTETHFTDKLRDQETNNDYFGARYFSSTLGRFTSPDWSEQPQAIPYASLMDPQSLNLYSYVGNNPASRVDKNGHCDSSGRNCSAWDYVAGAVGGVLNIVPGTLNLGIQTINAVSSAVGGPQFDELPMIQPDAHASGGGIMTGEAAGAMLPIGDLTEGVQLLNSSLGEARGLAAGSERAAQREAMRQEGIPTSQQPASQEMTKAGRQYTYETPEGTKVVQRNIGTDSSHPGQPHVEAGTPKPGGQRDSIGRPRLQNDKTKVNVNE